MAKKLFFSLLTVITLLVLFIVYQKINPAANRIFNAANGGINHLNGSGIQPTSVVKSPTVGANGIFLDVTQPVNNITVGSASVTLSGKTVANGTVSVNDQDLKADAQGNFSTTVVLQEGQNDIFVVAADDLGNSVEKDLTVNLESTQ